jgi:hypothetical protein
LGEALCPGQVTVAFADGLVHQHAHDFVTSFERAIDEIGKNVAQAQDGQSHRCDAGMTRPPAGGGLAWLQQRGFIGPGVPMSYGK